jgi:hypothetical protein
MAVLLLMNFRLWVDYLEAIIFGYFLFLFGLFSHSIYFPPFSLVFVEVMVSSYHRWVATSLASPPCSQVLATII